MFCRPQGESIKQWGEGQDRVWFYSESLLRIRDVRRGRGLFQLGRNKHYQEIVAVFFRFAFLFVLKENKAKYLV